MSAVVLTDDLDRVADATVAALREAGRNDLAVLVMFYSDDDDADAWYLEPLDPVSDADYAVMEKAVVVALGAFVHSARLDRAFGPVQEGPQ